jgi:hypothetical protein
MVVRTLICENIVSREDVIPSEAKRSSLRFAPIGMTKGCYRRSVAFVANDR